MAKILFVTTYHAMHMNVYLVVDTDGQAYLVCYEHETNEFGSMCPCCMFPNHREDIKKAVEELLSEGYQGKILWCSHKDYAEYGNHLDTDYPQLKQEHFMAGSAEKISDETKTLLHEEALRQLEKRAIKNFRRK